MTGRGKASNNQARQMKSAGRGGGEAREGGRWLPETWASLEGWGTGLNQRRAAPTPQSSHKKGGTKGVPPRSVCQQR